MSDANDPDCRKDRRIFGWSIVIGAIVGAGHGIPRYGVFTMQNLAMVGLGMIAVVGLAAAVIALLPARPLPPS